MRRFALIVVLAVMLGSTGGRAQAPAKQAAGEPKTTWFFYTVKWGGQDEFLDLFQRNHYPILKAMQKAGQYVSVRTFVPENHGDGRADWTFAVELVTSWPGLGRLTAAAMYGRDIYLSAGCAMAATLLLSLGVVSADLVSALIDPRVLELDHPSSRGAA